MIKVIVADDHPIVRQGIKDILKSAPDFEVVGETAHGSDVVHLTDTIEHDVLVLDITLPGLDGMDILKQIKAQDRHKKVLIFTMFPEDQYAVRAFRLGADGYLTKESSPAELISAVRKIAYGGKYVSDKLAEKLATGLQRDQESQPHEGLSTREYQVLCYLAQGLTIQMIAYALHISDKTVSTYRTRILEKMRMKTNSELTYYAIKHGLIQ